MLPTFAQILCSATLMALTSFFYAIFHRGAEIIRGCAKSGFGVNIPPEILILLQADEVLGRLWPLLLLALIAYAFWVRGRPKRMFVGHAIVSVILIAVMLFTMAAYDKLIAAQSTQAWQYQYTKLRTKVEESSK